MPGVGTPHPNRETLSAFADRELAAAERARVERHLSQCPACRAIVAQYRGTSDLFQRLPARRVPTSMNRDMWRRILGADERRRRSRWLPVPLPGPNALGVAVAALLIMALLPQLVLLYSALGLGRRQDAHLAAPTATEIPLAAPPVMDSPPPTAVPSPASGSSPSVGATSAAAGSAGRASVTATARPAQSSQAAASSPAATVTAAVQFRVVAGQIASVNRSQRTIVVAEVGAKTWQFSISEGTLFVRKDGQRLGFEDVGLGDQVEVTGFEAAPATTATTATTGTTTASTPAGPLLASQVKVVASVAQASQAPRVLVLLDGAEGLRAPQYGFTGDWIKRLGDTGYAVTAKDPASITGAASLKGVDLVVIGYPATLTNAALQAVKASKLPVLVGDPRLVQPLGLGQNLDPAQPLRRVPGKSVDIPPQAGLVTRGFEGETDVANDTVYRTPIVANGTVLATIADGGQKVTVWSVAGTTMYFGFWYSDTGQNHNGTYWTLFDRSVLFLLDKNPLGTTSGTLVK